MPRTYRILFVLRIDFDSAEVERTRRQTVDARPGYAAVGRAIDAARLITFGTLAILNVGNLSAERSAERFAWRRAASAASESTRTLAERDLDLDLLRAARDVEFQPVAGGFLSKEVDEVVVGLQIAFRRSQ